MYVPTILLLLIILAAKSDADCTDDKSQLAPIRLRKDLLCGYDKDTRPITNHKSAVKVIMRMILKYYNYDMHMNQFTVDSWMPLFWNDDHLKWDPNNYDSIKSIRFADSDIWMPDISIYNNRDQGGDQSAIGSVTCIVSYRGGVVCVPSTQHNSICDADLTKYPFDEHNCTIRFGSWVHNGEELNITPAHPAVNTDDLVPNGEWELVDTDVVRHPGNYSCCPNNTYPSINFSFKIRRLHGAHTASVILPAIALIITTLTPLWIAPDHSERLSLCYVNFISQILYLQYVSWMVPMNGDKIPLILLFARDSLLLAAFSIVFSVMLKNMVVNEKPAPGWMSKTVCVLVAFKPGQLAFLSGTPFQEFADDKSDEVGAIVTSQGDSSKSKDWLIFAKILDRVCFVVYLIIYVVMFLGFLP